MLRAGDLDLLITEIQISIILNCGRMDQLAHEAERLRRLWSRDRCRFSTSAQFSQIRVPEFTNSAARRFREVAPGDASAASLEKGDEGRQGLTPRPYDFRVHPLTPWFTGPEVGGFQNRPTRGSFAVRRSLTQCFHAWRIVLAISCRRHNQCEASEQCTSARQELRK